MINKCYSPDSNTNRMFQELRNFPSYYITTGLNGTNLSLCASTIIDNVRLAIGFWRTTNIASL